MKPKGGTRILLTLIVLIVALSTAVQNSAVHAQGKEITLILGGYSTPAEAFGEIIPLFRDYWFKKTGETVNFQESYTGSGAQSRAIVGGFEADIAALSLEGDITRIEKAGLITHNWQDNKYKGLFGSSLVVFTVRPGNPKQIKDWSDLVVPGVEILTPDPASSGGAQWNLLAALGAARRGNVAGYENGDEGGFKFLGDLLKNVVAFDKDARSSILNFENGVGDVALTYENEYYAGIFAQQKSQAASENSQTSTKYDIIYPSSTILIQNPVAVIDVNVDKHGVRPAAEAFVEFLTTPEAQTVFARNGYRPLDKTVLKDENIAKLFPAVKDIFRIEEFGGWSAVSTQLFGETGKITQLIDGVKGQ